MKLAFLTNMIHIKENVLNQNTLEIRLDGRLDDESVPVVAEVCTNHLRRKREIILDLEGLTYINRAGRTFLEQVKGGVSILNPPEFLELGQSLVKTD